MTVSESLAIKKKRPPTFQYLPPSRAKKLKQDWVLKQKVKSKWRHEKRKLEGSDKPQPTEEPVPASIEHVIDPQPQSSSSHPHRFPRKPVQPLPATEKSKDLREMAREAYSASSLHTYRSKKSKSEGRQLEQRKGKGQPNMKLRMNVMLEKIKRDIK